MDLEKIKESVIYELAHIKRVGGGNPRIHPNGFIQLDLAPVANSWHDSHQRGHSGAARRLHIWNPPNIELPHQETVNEVHDHVFDMRSTVIKGIQWQVLYNFIPYDPDEYAELTFEPTHEIYQAIYLKNSDSRLKATGKTGWLARGQWFPIYKGMQYTQPAFTLHDSEPQSCTVTIMEKTKIHEGDAIVVCPIDAPPDNSFDRASAMPVSDIWTAIEAALA